LQKKQTLWWAVLLQQIC